MARIESRLSQRLNRVPVRHVGLHADDFVAGIAQRLLGDHQSAQHAVDEDLLLEPLLSVDKGQMGPAMERQERAAACAGAAVAAVKKGRRAG